MTTKDSVIPVEISDGIAWLYKGATVQVRLGRSGWQRAVVYDPRQSPSGLIRVSKFRENSKRWTQPVYVHPHDCRRCPK